MCEIVWTQLLNFVYSTLKFPLGYGYVLPFFFAHRTVVPYPDSALTIFDIYFFVSLVINYNIYSSNYDISDLYKTTTCELSKLHTWFSINKLSLNLDKTNYMLFTNKKVCTSNFSVNKVEKITVIFSENSNYWRKVYLR